ncbi:MAG: DEAD/DEAH box helicase [Proteobacteria bacterium]|nr:DEAD/DEAH box helicase [Pseudomonadota bacterium]
MKKSSELNLIDELIRAIVEEGYDRPTPIQQQAIPPLLKGRDILGCAQTGTGKTAAFALPILQGLVESGGRKGRIRACVLTPTRELAAQIKDSFLTYGKYLDIFTTVIFGGVKQFHQEKELKKRPDILVATPGRLLDLASQGIVTLEHLEVFVLDEADRMLDMGFIHDVRKVIAMLPVRRQTLFFSATMPPAVAKLANSMLTDPVSVEVAPRATPVERIDQKIMFVDKRDKGKLLKHLLDDSSITKVLVFTRTKHLAGRLAKQLAAKGISAAAIHGNKSQGARTKALEDFRGGKTRILVATDIAARGIDVDQVSHVINYDLPNESESYVHRIGRTARAGADGISISFCCGDEIDYLRSIEKLIVKKIPVVTGHPFESADAAQGRLDGEDISKIKRTPMGQRPNRRNPRRPKSGRGSRGKQRKTEV